MGMLPVAGLIADKIGIARSMTIAAIVTASLTIPLFTLLSGGSILEVFLAKVGFAMLSAWFIGPFHALVQSMFLVRNRYSLISLNYSIGAQVGGAMPGLSLLLWKQTNNIMSIAAILIFWALVGALCCLFSKKESQKI
jgi:MHS family proline/betaine transporter-like MFS transporter